jgi:CRP/FNR family transcriptional regulator
VLGVSACITGGEYEATATVQGPAEISFLRQGDFLRLMRARAEFALWVTQHLSHDYSSTCHEIRNLMLSDSASEKFARFLVERLQEKKEAPQAAQMKLALTHEEIGQMIGTSRETVTRLFAGFRRKRLIQLHGSTLVVPNRIALEAMLT